MGDEIMHPVFQFSQYFLVEFACGCLEQLSLGYIKAVVCN